MRALFLRKIQASKYFIEPVTIEMTFFGYFFDSDIV